MNKDSIDNSGHLMVIGPGAAPGHPHTQPDARGTGGEALCEHLVLEMPVLLKRIPANHFCWIELKLAAEVQVKSNLGGSRTFLSFFLFLKIEFYFLYFFGHATWLVKS